jgi:hypothetical protein
VAGLGKVQFTSGCDSIENLKSEVRFRLHPIGKDLAAAKILLEAGENSPQFKLALAEYEPLLAAATARDELEEELRQDRQRAEAQLLQARETTWRRALERAESSPIIQKAERELADAKAAEAAVGQL